jgi:hypothetical protein
MATSDDARSRRDAALALVDLRRVYASVLAFAVGRARSRDHGEELVQRVMAAAIDPEQSPWDPERDPDLARYLMGRVNGALASDRKKARLRSDSATVAAVVLEHYEPKRTVEDDLAARQRDARDLAELYARFAGDDGAVERALLDLYQAGVSDVGEQAASIGVDVPEVYRARRRIVRNAREIRARSDREPQAAATPAARESDDELGP